MTVQGDDLLSPFDALPDDLLPRILLETGGAWRVADRPGPESRAHAVWSVCRAWRDVAWGDPAFPSLLIDAMTRICEGGANGALLRACSPPLQDDTLGMPPQVPPHCRPRSMVTDIPDLVARLVKRAGGGLSGDYREGLALIHAAEVGDEDIIRILLETLFSEGSEGYGGAHQRALEGAIGRGHVGIVKMLLEWLQRKHLEVSQGRHFINEMEYALREAARAGKEEVVRLILTWPGEGVNVRADADNGEALVTAAGLGHGGVVRLLLGWPGGSAPFADCRDGEALVAAAEGGHLAVVRLLLQWPRHAPHADCMGGEAFLAAAAEGHIEVARTLLQWPGGTAPRADCQNGLALCRAARGGHERMVRMLLEWPGGHAPRADCQDGHALCLAAQSGYESVVRTLLQWPGGSAPRADCRDGRALIWAAERGHEGVVRLLLNWPEFAPGKAARKAAEAGAHKRVRKLLASKGW